VAKRAPEQHLHLGKLLLKCGDCEGPCANGFDPERAICVPLKLLIIDRVHVVAKRAPEQHLHLGKLLLKCGDCEGPCANGFDPERAICVPLKLLLQHRLVVHALSIPQPEQLLDLFQLLIKGLLVL